MLTAFAYLLFILGIYYVNDTICQQARNHALSKATNAITVWPIWHLVVFLGELNSINSIRFDA